MGKPNAKSKMGVRKSRSRKQEVEVEDVESSGNSDSGAEAEGESEEEDEEKDKVRAGSAVASADSDGASADSDDNLDSDSNGDNEEDNEDENEEKDAGSEKGNNPSASSGMSEEEKAPRDRQEEKKMSKMKKEALAYRQKLASRGVLYLSRVPPFMKPNKLRQLLSPYGDITRLFLQEEDASVRKRRKHGGGNGSKQFVEGWIEYSEKDTAKHVARALNNNRIGGKKGDFYYDDLWNLKV
jgi:ESF2/ABP1 family protein